MSKEAQMIAAAEVADRYIEIVLSEEPGLLVERAAGQGSKDIAKSAKALAEFREQLIKALADQPLPDLEQDDDAAGERVDAPEADQVDHAGK